VSNEEILQLAADTRQWLLDQGAQNIAVLDQVRAAIGGVLNNLEAIPSTSREARLLTLGALFAVSEIVEDEIPGYIARIYCLAGLHELVEFCKDRVGEDYLACVVR
jgi:hypothetical protein